MAKSVQAEEPHLPFKALSGGQCEGNDTGGEVIRETGLCEGNCWSMKLHRNIGLKVSTRNMCYKRLLPRTTAYWCLSASWGPAEHISVIGMMREV